MNIVKSKIQKQIKRFYLPVAIGKCCLTNYRLPLTITNWSMHNKQSKGKMWFGVEIRQNTSRREILLFTDLTHELHLRIDAHGKSQ